MKNNKAEKVPETCSRIEVLEPVVTFLELRIKGGLVLQTMTLL